MFLHAKLFLHVIIIIMSILEYNYLSHDIIQPSEYSMHQDLISILFQMAAADVSQTHPQDGKLLMYLIYFYEIYTGILLVNLY